MFKYSIGVELDITLFRVPFDLMLLGSPNNGSLVLLPRRGGDHGWCIPRGEGADHLSLGQSPGGTESNGFCHGSTPGLGPHEFLMELSKGQPLGSGGKIRTSPVLPSTSTLGGPDLDELSVLLRPIFQD